MSTDGTRGGRRAAVHRRRSRAFAGAVAIVVAALAAVGLVGGAVTNIQGPRVTNVQSDPAAAVSSSGSRLIVTMNQSLRPLKAAQVTVTPAADFTVDTSGRAMGVRFLLPLHDDTEYTVRFRDVVGVGGGPAAEVVERLRTPRLQVYVLQRGPSGDRILRTGMAGDGGEAVFADRHIEDFRATPGHIIVETLDTAGRAHLTVTDPDGRHRRSLALPGPGDIAQLQIADRGDVAGYTYTDPDPGKPGAQISALYIASLKDAAARAAPQRIRLPGKDTRVADWRFVPDTDSVLVLTFDGRMILGSSTGGPAAELGTGSAIDGIARGSSVAVVQRADGAYAVDLATGKQEPLVSATENGRAVPGHMGVVTPIPGTAGASVRPYTVLDVAGGSGAGSGVPEGTTVYRVGVDGASSPLLRLPPTSAIMQTCVSPSARYLAVTIVPDAATSVYDDYQLPVPQSVITRIVELADGHLVRTLTGFGVSWCQVPPPLTQ